MPSGTLLILNPKAGSGAARWGRVQRLLGDALGEIEVARTRGPRDASRIGREAVRAGVSRIVVGGGDGTLSEVVTGILAADLGGYVELGILPLGSACDFARGLGLPSGLADAVALLRDGARSRVDAGRIMYRDGSGARCTAYFLNEASFGSSGLTVAMVNRAGKRVGPKLAFALGSIGSILSGSRADVCIRVDQRIVFEGPISMVVAANGGYFGGGMRVAPEACVDDGALDIIVIERLGRMRLLSRLPSLFRGTHLRYAEAHHYRGTRLEATLRGDGSAPLDVDGEALGDLPISIELIPKAIGLFGLPSRAPAADAGD